MTTAYLSIGSNLGNRQQHLQTAVTLLKAHPAVNQVVVSGLYQTEPVGPVQQDDFLNIAVRLETTLTAPALLAVLHEIERAGNRERQIHWGPRTIDLDILWFGEAVIDTATLQVPHPEMTNRLFVLAPLREVATPERVATVTELIAETTDMKQVMRIGEFEDHANE